jgi:hypothetical protein
MIQVGLLPLIISPSHGNVAGSFILAPYLLLPGRFLALSSLACVSGIGLCGVGDWVCDLLKAQNDSRGQTKGIVRDGNSGIRQQKDVLMRSYKDL